MEFFVAPFVAGYSFSLLYRVPKRYLVPAAFVGALGYTVFFFLDKGVHSVAAVFLAASLVALLSEVIARVVRQPVTLFLVPGIIPLVPGAKAYVTMLNFVRHDYLLGLDALVSTFFMAGAVALGMILVSSFFRVRRRRRRNTVG